MNKDLTVVYLCHNRSYYTAMTLPKVIEECNRSKSFNQLIVYDDNSQDDTWKVLDSMKFPKNTTVVKGKYGNTVDQFNDAVKKSSDQYLYYLGNDILLPDNIFDLMCALMDRKPDALSIMIQECAGYPIFGPKIEVNEHSFTSSLGIHRRRYFRFGIGNEKRFFGFQPYQAEMMERFKLKVFRVEGASNTNLDMSCWGRQKEYKEKGYSRTGLVGDQANNWKW